MDANQSPQPCSQRFLGLCILLAAIILAASIVFASRPPGSCPFAGKPTAPSQAVSAIAPAANSTPVIPPPSGTWKVYMGENWIGVATLRCENRKVAWYGKSIDQPPIWNNVFFGTIDDNGLIRGEWMDLPGAMNLFQGRLVGRYDVREDVIFITEKTGGSTTTRLVRVPDPSKLVLPKPGEPRQ